MTQQPPISLPVDAILNGFRAALVRYAGEATAQAEERAIMAEVTVQALQRERESTTTERDADGN